MWDGFDKRKFPRLNLHCEITLQPVERNTPIKAVTENVGVGGICAILNEPLARFTQCRILLELEDALPAVEGMGRIVWTVPTSQAGKRGKRFDTGVEFLDLSPEGRELLRKFIQDRLSQAPVRVQP